MTPLRLRTTALMVAAAFGVATPAVYANPEGAKVVNGQATITNNGSTLVIKNSPGAIINWQSFSIGKGETTNFIQQSVNSAILNRVIGANPSIILGDLTSNGKVFLINANGVIFGKGATVDAAGLVVSSLDITDQDFKNGTLRFVGSAASGDISVAGVIRSTDGDVYLIAPNITNTGSIEAVGGNAILAAGQSVEIVGTDASDIKFDVQNTSNTALNLGQISGDAVGIFAGTLTQAGGVNANAFSVSGGKVILTAQGNATLAAGSTTSADNAAGTAGSVSVESQTGTLTVAQGATVSASGARGGFVTLLADQGTTTISGSVAATGTLQLGGSIDVLGANVGVTSGATVDASGAAGGGALVVGGAPRATGILLAKNTSVASGAALIADATSQGNGGSIDVYGVDTVGVQGSISARGGVAGGNGGTVDTSGAVVEVSGPLTAAARNASGRAGTWTLDPNSIEIDNGTAYSTTPVLNTTTGVSEVNASYLSLVLNGGTSVVLSTATAPGGSGPTGPNTGYFIDVSAPINVNTTAYGVALTLNAGGQIAFQTSGSLTSTGYPLTLNLNSDLDGGSSGTEFFAPISMPGGTINISSGYFYNNSTITASKFKASATNTTAIFYNYGTIDASADDNGQSGAAGGSIGATGYTVGNLGTMLADGSSPAYTYSTGGSGGTISVIGAANINDRLGTLSADGGNGGYGAGGTGGTITLATTGAGSLNLSSSTIRANGGNSGTGYSGGIGGLVSITSATVNLTAAYVSAIGGTGGSGVYGIGGAGGAGGVIDVYASNRANFTGATLIVDGGAGSSTSVGGPITYQGGVGGSAGTINVSAGSIYVEAATLSAQGGSNLSAGASGGAGGTINLSASDVLSVDSGSTLTVVGGAGANAIAEILGIADNGGAGGAGGTISIIGQSGLDLFGSNLLLDGGAGGNGVVTTDAQAISNGGAGGAAGTFSLTAYTADLASGINLSANGGQGGAGGAVNSNATTALTAGSGGAGGAGGLVTITAGAGGLELEYGNLSAIGGDAGAGGGLDPANTNPLAIGGAGGNGGVGGKINLATTAGGVLNLTVGTITASGGNAGAAVSGGIGGTGGTGGTLTLTTTGGGALNLTSSTLSAAGGNSGTNITGGTGGTITVATTGGGFLNMSGSTLSVLGGNSGAGGSITLSAAGGGALNLTSSTILASGGNSATGLSGGIGGMVSLGSSSDLTLIDTDVYAQGGTGGAGNDAIGGAGGAGGTIGLYALSGTALLDSSNLYVDGGVGSSTSTGPTIYQGGVGGSAGTINVSALNITLSSATLSAQGGVNLDAGASGGAGGTINLSAAGTIEAPLSSSLLVNGGAGANAIVEATGTADDAGAGGAGGTISILSQSAFNLSGVTLSVDGGAGGTGVATTDGQTISNGGAGGAAGALSITGWYGVTLTGVSLSADGGQGGDGGSFNTTATPFVTAGSGGAGGAAGLITIAALYGTTGVSVSNTTITAIGGAGGAGASLDPGGLDPLASGGTGGAGGAGGQIVITSTAPGAIALINTTAIVAGGNGGDGGTAETDLGGGGSGGAGGVGATIFGANDSYAIVLNSSGTITIDSNSSLTAMGGNGGAGQDSAGIVRSAGSVGPGNGGNGGDAYGIELLSYSGVNLTGTLTIQSGAGGNGGSLTSSAVAPQGTATIAGGNGGNGGNVINPLNIAANLDDTSGNNYGTVTTDALSVITIIGGAGGSGGSSSDNPTNFSGTTTTYGPGNGGTGGSIGMANISAYGQILLSGAITIAGGAGGSGGSITTLASQNGVQDGYGGSGGSFSGLTIAVNTPTQYNDPMLLYGTIQTDVGLGGAYGLVGGDYEGTAYEGSAGFLNLYDSSGTIDQGGVGAFTSNTGALNVNFSANDGNVYFDGPGNVISTATGSAQYELAISSTGNSGVNFTAQNLTAGYGINLTAFEMTLSGSIQTSYDQINISADNLTAGGLTNLAVVTPYVSPANTTGGDNDIYAWISIQPITSTQPIIITADSYNSYGVENANASGSSLIIGSEIFSSFHATELVIGQSGGSSSIAFNSLNNTPGTVQMPGNTQLTLYATNVTQDQYTTLSTDYLLINANNVNLTGLTPATSGQPIYLSSGVTDSGSNDYLNISAAAGKKIVIGNLTGTQLNYSGGITGIQGYEYVTIGADQLAIQAPITMYNSSSSQLILGPVTENTPAAINPTAGYTGFGLSNSDLANIYSQGGSIYIGGNNVDGLTVNGPVTLPNVTNNTLSLTAGSGDVNFSGSSFTLDNSDALNVYANGGNINDTGMVLTAGNVDLYASGSIGAAGAPIYLAVTSGEIGAETYSGNVYLQGTTNLTSEYIYAPDGIVNIAMPGLGFYNEGSIVGDSVTITGASIQNANNYGNISGSTISLNATNQIKNYGNISGSTISLTASNLIYNDGYANISGSSVSLTSGNQLQLYGSVYSQGDLNLSGAAITIASAGDTGALIQGQDITINGGSLLVSGDISPLITHGLRGHYSSDPANESALVDANGTLNVTLSGDMTVAGGNFAGASAALISGDDSNYTIGGALQVQGGTQTGTFAVLDPTHGATMNISAQSINLTGGSGDSSYAAIVSAGNVILTAPQYIALHDGSGANSDAVVIANSGLGTITANTPSCINCNPEMGSYPLTNNTTEVGFYGGAAAATPPAPPAPPAPPPPPAAPPPAPAPQAYGNNELDALIEDLLTLLDTPLNNGNVPPVQVDIFVDGGADGCF